MKEYLKPEVELISLQAQEAITDDIVIDGSTSLDDSIFG